MSNNTVQSITKKLLLPLGILVGGSIIFGAASQASAEDVNAGPIWNNDHARDICPQACSSVGLEWNGNRYTNDPGRNSVCGCVAR